MEHGGGRLFEGTSMRRSVHWFCRRPSPYNDALFRTVAADPEIELMVHYGDRTDSAYSWKETVAGGYRHTFDSGAMRKAVRARQCLFVVGGWAEPREIALLTSLMLRRISYILWSDAPDPKKGRSWLRRSPRSVWLNSIFAHALKVMGTGEPCLRLLQELGCPEKKLVNFPYWIDPFAYGPSEPAERDALRLLVCGRLIAAKGFGVALHAYGTARRIRPGASITLTVLGDGPMLEELKRCARETGFERDIDFAGWLEPDGVRRTLRRSDLLLHPAYWEPFGVVVLEAMASGLPVLASNRTVAALERVQEGQSGFFHEAGDVEALARQIVFFVDRPDAKTEFGERAKTIARQWPRERALEILKNEVFSAL
jgi:glycosyltransferase involved in cell wall biosynthesis